MKKANNFILNFLEYEIFLIIVKILSFDEEWTSNALRRGPAEIWIRILGVKVQIINHYTTEPELCLNDSYVKSRVYLRDADILGRAVECARLNLYLSVLVHSCGRGFESHT